MSGWFGEWWPLLATLLIFVVGLSWLVLRLAGSSHTGRRTAFETVFRKGMVQPIVTHIMAWTFALMASSLIIFFLYVREFDRAEDVFSYVVAVIGPIIGFWFGSRGREASTDASGATESGSPSQRGTQAPAGNAEP